MQAFSSQLLLLLSLLINQMNNARYFVSVDSSEGSPSPREALDYLRSASKQACFTEVNASNVHELREFLKHRYPVFLDLTVNRSIISPLLWTLAEKGALNILKIQGYCNEPDKSILARERSSKLYYRTVLELCQEKPGANNFSLTAAKKTKNLIISDDNVDDCKLRIGFDEPGGNLTDTLLFIKKATRSSDCRVNCKGRAAFVDGDERRMKWGCDKCLSCSSVGQLITCFNSMNNNRNDSAPAKEVDHHSNYHSSRRKKGAYRSMSLEDLYSGSGIFWALIVCCLALGIPCHELLISHTLTHLLLVFIVFIKCLLNGYQIFDKTFNYHRHIVTQYLLTIVQVAAMGPDTELKLLTRLESPIWRFWLERALIGANYAGAILIGAIRLISSDWPESSRSYIRASGLVVPVIQVLISLSTNLARLYYRGGAAIRESARVRAIILRAVAQTALIGLLWRTNAHKYYDLLLDDMLSLVPALFVRLWQPANRTANKGRVQPITQRP